MQDRENQSTVFDKPSIVFVGNGDIDKDLSDTVDSADVVIRSQTCRGFEGITGSKADILCVRPSNEEYGFRVAEERRIPQKAAENCHMLLVCSRHAEPSLEKLYLAYPCLRNKPVMWIKEAPTRNMMLKALPGVDKGRKLTDPTMGFCLLSQFVCRRLYRIASMTCVGFSWNRLCWNHAAAAEKCICESWAGKGHIKFI